MVITFFVPYKRAGTHFSIHPAKRQYTPPSKKSQKSLKNQNSYILHIADPSMGIYIVHILLYPSKQKKPGSIPGGLKVSLKRVE